ncbi:unnamed protein product [Lactuca virosa]|uniref:Uncharacterized protein n=1 Tax=Lactuca virosa TaxID=75947 RepID=A0AAU9PCS3_9ASTR|nr:unnamed protein product [Lactuca virosa]
MNITRGNEFLTRLCGEEEEGNDNDIGDDDDGGEEEANFDASGNGEPSQQGGGEMVVQLNDNVNVGEVHVQQEVMERPIAALLKKIRRKKSERILKLKLAKRVGDEDAPENSKDKALALD